MKKEFSEEEVEFIRSNHMIKSAREIALVLGRTESSIKNKRRSLGLVTGYKRNYDVNESFFDSLDPTNCYWLGFLAADGYLRDKHYHIQLIVAIKDKEHLSKFKNDIGYGGDIKDRCYKISKKNRKKFVKSKYYSVGITICSKRIYHRLVELNVTPNKSLSLQPPQNLTREQSLAYIKGIIDGDGSILRDKNGRLQLSIDGSESIIKWIVGVFDEVSPPRYKKLIAKPRKRKNQYVYKVTGVRAQNILDILSRVKTPELSRKWSHV